MSLTLVACGLALVALPGLAANRGGHLEPHEWARLAAASLWTGLMAIRLGLLFGVVPILLHATGNEALEELCHRGFGSSHHNTAVGVGSGVALGALQIRMMWSRRRSRATRAALRVEGWIGRHYPLGDHELVLIPARGSIAYAIEGTPSQIVLSEHLTGVLTDAEVAAVLRHEQCHLEHSHQRYLTLAVAADAALGPLAFVRRSTETLRLAIERWADEAAAATGGARRTLRNALAKMVESMATAVPAFNAANITARIEALDADTAGRSPGGGRRAVGAPVAALVALVCATALVVNGPLHHGVSDLLQCCLL